MDKRTFLKSSAVLGVMSFIDPFSLIAKHRSTLFAPFELPPLPYATNALEPYIDKLTMEIHHGKHHQAYVDKLNTAVTGTPYENMKIENILAAINAEDESIRNNGGGHYNHTLFWNMLTPQNTMPQGKLVQAINQQFGSLDNFREEFNNLALNHFGSGWVWLIIDNKNKLRLVETMNQDNPLMKKIVEPQEQGFPILALDIWEHAYYLKYQNRRIEYIKSFWNIVNWKEVEKRFEMAEKQRLKKWSTVGAD